MTINADIKRAVFDQVQEVRHDYLKAMTQDNHAHALDRLTAIEEQYLAQSARWITLRNAATTAARRSECDTHVTAYNAGANLARHYIETVMPIHRP